MRVEVEQEVGEEEEEEETEESHDHTQCQECESDEVIREGTEWVCQGCGLVLGQDEIDRGPEWRAFNQNERDKLSRVGSPTTLAMHDRGLTTVMGNVDTRSWSDERKEQLERMEDWNTWCQQDSKGRGLKYGLGEIQRLTSELELPRSIKEDSAMIFREAHSEDLCPGRSLDGMAAASVYLSCRRNRFSRTYKEVSEFARRDRGDIYGCALKMKSNLDDVEISPPDPSEYVSRFVTNLREEHAPDNRSYQQIQGSTENFVRLSKEEEIHIGHSPDSIVAAAMYIAVKKTPGDDLTQGEVASACGVTTSAVRKMYRKQCDTLNISFDDKKTKTGEKASDFLSNAGIDFS